MTTPENNNGEYQPNERRLMSIAGRLGIEIVIGVAVGSGIGYFIDKFFSTKPIFFIIFALFGVAAGVLNVYRFIKEFDERVGYLDRKTPKNKDQDLNGD
jgi:ATP synthase protein I